MKTWKGIPQHPKPRVQKNKDPDVRLLDFLIGLFVTIMVIQFILVTLNPN